VDSADTGGSTVLKMRLPIVQERANTRAWERGKVGKIGHTLD